MLLQTGRFLMSHLSSQGVIVVRQALSYSSPAEPLIGTAVGPSPTQGPLVSNCQPATVGGSSQPLVSATVAPPPPLLYIRGARIEGDGFPDVNLPSSQLARFVIKVVILVPTT